MQQLALGALQAADFWPHLLAGKRRLFAPCRRWEQVRARATLQANGIMPQSVARSASANALDLLVHDAAATDAWLQQQRNTQVAGGLCQPGLARDPSLATLLREEAGVC